MRERLSSELRPGVEVDRFDPFSDTPENRSIRQCAARAVAELERLERFPRDPSSDCLQGFARLLVLGGHKRRRPLLLRLFVFFWRQEMQGAMCRGDR